MKLNTAGMAAFDLDASGSLRRASEGKNPQQGEESAKAPQRYGGPERTQSTGALVAVLLSERWAGSEVRLSVAAKGTQDEHNSQPSACCHQHVPAAETAAMQICVHAYICNQRNHIQTPACTRRLAKAEIVPRRSAGRTFDSTLLIERDREAALAKVI